MVAFIILRECVLIQVEVYAEEVTFFLILSAKM